MIAEGAVLLRVEYLQHGRRRIASIVRRKLVDLVEQHHRVDRSSLLHCGDNAAGHGADVRAPMPPDLRLIAHAAEADADKLAAHRGGNQDRKSTRLNSSHANISYAVFC